MNGHISQDDLAGKKNHRTGPSLRQEIVNNQSQTAWNKKMERSNNDDGRKALKSRNPFLSIHDTELEGEEPTAR